MFPSRYYFHVQRIGPPPSYIQIDLAGEQRNSSSGFPLAIILGRSFTLGKNFFGTVEFKYAQIKFAPSQEVMTTHEDYSYYDSEAKKQIRVNRMTGSMSFQTNKKQAFYLGSFSLGWLPFKSIDLAFCGDIGIGYTVKKFHSGTCESYDDQLVKLKDGESYDQGRHLGQGNWLKDRLTLHGGCGLRLFFSKKIWLDIRYRIIWLLAIPKWGSGFFDYHQDLGSLYYQPLQSPIHWLAAAVAYSF